MLTLLSVLYLLGKGFHPISMLFLSFIIIFALNIHIVNIQVSVDVLLQPCFKNALFKRWLKEKSTLHLFSVTNVKSK